MDNFYQTIYQHIPDQERSRLYVAYGSVNNPMFLTVAEFMENHSNGHTVPQDSDLFYTPLTFNKAARSKETAAGGCVAWIDDDLHNTVEPLLPPTFVIKSGRGFHRYYVLDNYYSAEDIERCNKALFAHARQGGGEWSRAQFLRVPGSINWKCRLEKYKEEYPGPLPCAIVEYNPEYVYSPTDLLKVGSFQNDLLTTPLKKDGTLDQSKRDFKVASLLAEWGIAEYAWEYVLLHISQKARDRRDYLDLTIANARTQVQAQTQTVEPKAPGGKRLSNAEMLPVAKLKTPDGQEAGLLVQVSFNDTTIFCPASNLDFASSRGVINWFAANGAGNRTFMGTDRDAKNFFSRLESTCPEVYRLEVEQAGRYATAEGQRVFIYCNDRALVYPEGEADIFWRPKKRDASVRLYLSAQPPHPDIARYIVALVQGLQTPTVMQPALGWVMATPFKTVLEDELNTRFPVLLLFGFPGSGKSSLIGQALLPLLGCFRRATASDSTKFSLLVEMGLATSWPAWFGEFRATNLNVSDFLQLLRETYDGQQQSRGRPDLSVDHFNLCAPVVVDGENPFPDTAACERTLSLKLDKEAIAQDSPLWIAFTAWQQIARAKLESFAYSYLQWTLSLGAEDIQPMLTEARWLLQRHTSSVRMNSNYAIAWVGLSLLRRYCQDHGLDVVIRQDVPAFVEAMRNTYVPGLGIRTEADTLCERVAHYQHMLDVVFDEETDILWFNMTNAARFFRINYDTAILQVQLENRRSAYAIGPMPLAEKGGGLYWGLHIAKAQSFGLDVPRPGKGADMVEFKVDEKGLVK